MNHTDWLTGQLKDDDFAAHYLTAAAQDLEPAVFTAALRHVIDARGGLAKVADVGKLSRQSLYKAFPVTGQEPHSQNHVCSAAGKRLAVNVQSSVTF